MDYAPLKLRPCYKNYLWGGRRLKTEYGKADAPEITAESWELSAHPDGQSVVEGGPLSGKTLSQLGELDRSGFWGSCCKTDRFPILVKLIDAAKDLSIQVHPSDETALVELGERGKAEMWYIVDCHPQASIYFGLSRQVSQEEFLRRVREGTVDRVLNRVPVKPGDVFYIMPGIIHAIGRGIVVAEIQQNSNTTFRVYDYQRKDAQGNLRPLHLDRAVQVLDFRPTVPDECRANGSVQFSGFTMTEMFSCKYFRAFKFDIMSEARLACDGSSFHHLLCVEGEGEVLAGEKTYPFHRGESYFIPAAMGEYYIRGACRVLLSRVWEDER